MTGEKHAAARKKTAEQRERDRLRMVKVRAEAKTKPGYEEMRLKKNEERRAANASPEHKEELRCTAYSRLRLRDPAAQELLLQQRTTNPMFLRPGEPVAFFDVMRSQWVETTVQKTVMNRAWVIFGCALNDVPEYARFVHWRYLKDVRPLQQE